MHHVPLEEILDRREFQMIIMIRPFGKLTWQRKDRVIRMIKKYGSSNKFTLGKDSKDERKREGHHHGGGRPGFSQL